VTPLFVETSALLAVIFREKTAAKALDRLEQADRLIASRLIRVEAERALLRLALDRPRTEKVTPSMRRELNLFWPKVDFIEISREICEAAGRIAPASRLRTPDAIHLATFHRVRELAPHLELLSFDERILEAADAG
jgi:predicted nucleic acid-binding protein